MSQRLISTNSPQRYSRKPYASRTYSSVRPCSDTVRNYLCHHGLGALNFGVWVPPRSRLLYWRVRRLLPALHGYGCDYAHLFWDTSLSYRDSALYSNSHTWRTICKNS